MLRVHGMRPVFFDLPWTPHVLNDCLWPSAVPTQVRTHEALVDLMRWGDCASKVEIKYDELSDHQADTGDVCVRATVLFPAPFAALRQRFCEGGDDSFVLSLWQSLPWDSGRGGKSGSTFLKTLDGRYLLKQERTSPCADSVSNAPASPRVHIVRRCSATSSPSPPPLHRTAAPLRRRSAAPPPLCRFRNLNFGRFTSTRVHTFRMSRKRQQPCHPCW